MTETLVTTERNVIAPQALAALPDVALQALLDCLLLTEELVVLPVQTLLGIVALLLKPTGDDRPVTVLAKYYRVWSGLQRDIHHRWQQEKAGFWGRALRNSAALRAGILRAAGSELSFLDGKSSADALLDMEKFYDNVDVHQLSKLAQKHQYPTMLLCLGLQMHLGVRGLKCFNIHPGHKTPSNGIIAGCTQSTTFQKSSSWMQ